MVYIFLANGFEEIEALTQADYLTRAGIAVSLVGIGSHSVTGGHGITVMTDISIDEISTSNTDMIILPGGLGGVKGIKASNAAISFIKSAYSKNIKISAICAAPTILAELDMLKGVHCICYPDMTDILASHGAIVMTEKSVVCDGNFITSKAAGTSEEFAFEIIKALKGQKSADAVKAAICAR